MNENILNLDVPRPTGLSRSFLIIYILITFINYKSKNFLIIKRIIQVISVIFIILLSSRASIFLLCLILLLNLTWLNRNKINFYETLIFNLIIPIMIVSLIIFYKESLFKEGKFKQYYDETSNPLSLNLREFTNFRPDRPQTGFTSGRLNDWKDIIKSNKNIFFGNGVMGDRFLISQSASNGVLYTYASSGLIGSLLFIFLSIILFLNSLKIIFTNHYRNNNLQLISALLMIVMMLRSVLENSYSVFGIDFLIFSSSLAILIKFQKN